MSQVRSLIFIIAITIPIILHPQSKTSSPSPVVFSPVKQDISPPLRDIPPAPWVPKSDGTEKEQDRPVVYWDITDGVHPGPDPVAQTKMGSREGRSPFINFEGTQNTDNGSTVAPPDTEGDIGLNHYFQMNNNIFEIFDRDGNTVTGPSANTTIWSGFNGNWSGKPISDPVVLYDEDANRWFVTVFTTTPDGSGDYFILIAYSTSGDPTGTYNRYAYAWSTKPDYAKYAIWPSAIFMGCNTLGQDVCAFNRATMISGGSPPAISFNNPDRPSSTFHAVIPADCDGPFPPASTPGYFFTINDDAWSYNSDDRLMVWEFDVDWGYAPNSTWTLVQSLNTAAFSAQFSGGWDNIPQQGTTQKLDAIAEVLMYRVQHRYIGGTHRVVLCHTIDENGSDHAAIRWYELRKSGTSWSIYQQSTYSPDANHRWMGSIAMNMDGDIALGFSISSSSMYPSIRYTGRKAGDALNTMTFEEVTIFDGPDYQWGANRWGDYSLMSVDPVDDFTFWYTNEYSGTSSNWARWQTRICSFMLDCSAGATSQYEYISNVTVGSINNSSGWSPGGYGDYRHISTTMHKGSPYPVSVSVGSPFSGDEGAIWVDWNEDGDYNDAGETITPINGSPGTGPYTATIIPPLSATTGTKTMRIRLDYNTTPPPCGTSNFGEVEDYSIVLEGTTVNVWEGDFNHYWSQQANWSLGHVPVSTEDVLIPSTYTYYPYVHGSLSTFAGECNNIEVATGARLEIRDGTLEVFGNMDIYGVLEASNVNAVLTTNGDLYWGSGSTVDISVNFPIHHYGYAWEFATGANVYIDNGTAYFNGSGIQYIRTKDSDSHFNKIYISKTGGYVAHSGASSAPLRTNNYFYIHTTGTFYSYINEEIRVAGNFYNNDVCSLDLGTLVMEGSSADIYWNGTGYLNNLEIVNSTGSIGLQDPLTVNGDFLISSGNFNQNGHALNVFGNWTNSAGAGGYTPGTGTVIFNGADSTDINSDEAFYNVVVNKTFTGYQDLELDPGVTVSVQNVLELQAGTMEMESGSTLEIGDSLIIADNAGLNANDGSCTVSVGGRWTNNNDSPPTSYSGFYSGLTSTVIFMGSANQYLTNVYGMEEFAFLTLDLANDANFRPYDSIHVQRDLNILRGDWDDASGSLIHYFEGDFNVAPNAGAGYFGSTGSPNTSVFTGETDQEISWDPVTTDGSFGDVIIDKVPYSGLSRTQEEEGQMQPPADGSRAMAVFLLTDVISLNGYDLTIEEGKLDLNGHYYRCTGDITVSDGGTLAIDDNAWLEVGSGRFLSIYNGGILEVIGSSGNEAEVRPHSSNYAFDVYSGGTIKAEHAIFSYMDVNGVNCRSGSIVDPTYSFHHCTFRNGIAGLGSNALLTLENSQDLVINNASFQTSGTPYNVFKNVNAGSCTFNNATGVMAGPLYEFDPNDRIHWSEYGHWNGSVSTDWNTPGNWAYDIVPDITVDAYIPPGCPNYPEVDENLGVNYSSASYIYSCKSLDISSGAELAVVNGKNITTAGDMTVTGRLDIGNDLVCNSGCVLDLYDSIYLGKSAGEVGAFLLKAGAVLNQYSTSKLFVEALSILNGSQYNGYNGALYMYVDGAAAAVQQIQVDDDDSFFNSLIIHSSSSSYLFDCQTEVVTDYLGVYGDLELNGYNLQTEYADILGSLTIAADTLSVTTNGPIFYTGSNLSQSAGLIDCDGDFKVYGGTFNITDGDIWVARDFYDENDHFDMTGGIVIFDSPVTGHIFGTPDFFNLGIAKPTGILESGNDGNGVNIHVKNYLSLGTGIFELNTGTVLDIDGPLFNTAYGIIDADDPYPVNIHVGQDWLARYTSLPSFLPGTGSAVIFDGTDSTDYQVILEYEDFNRIVVDASSSYVRPSGYVDTDICTYCDTLEIINGTFAIGGFRTEVNNRLDVHGTLRADAASDTLLVHDICWKPGSEDVIDDGKIFVTGDWIFENGTNANISSGNTVYFRDQAQSYILNNDEDAAFFNLDIDKSGGSVWIDNVSTNMIKVLGEMNVHSPDLFHIRYDSLHVAGPLDVESGATMRLFNSGFLELDSDFTLNGFMDLDGGGEVLVHGLFEEAATGRIDMDAGSFTVDASASTSRAWQSIGGEMNLSGTGVFEVMHNHIDLPFTFDGNISGGTIRPGGSFTALTPGIFQPTGGVVEYTGGAGSGNYCDLGQDNWFHNLTIDGGTNSWQIYGAGVIAVKKDLHIQSSSFNCYNDTIYLGDDWTNDVGIPGFIEGSGLVVFNGTSPTDKQLVSGATEFYDVTNLNVDHRLELSSPTYIFNDFYAAEGGPSCVVLITTPSVVDIENLYLPQGEFGLSSSFPFVYVGSLVQGGTIEVTNGLFTVDDILEPAIVGEYILHNGTINLVQDETSYLDLEGDVTIYNGEFNVYGGTDQSYWPYTSSGHILTMSGGVFNFADVGIYINNNDLTHNITGGTIKTTGDFGLNSGVTVFTPTGGEVILYGVYNSYVSLRPGNHFYNIVVDKNAATVTAGSNMDVKNTLEVRSGTFDDDHYSLIIGP